MFIRDVETNEQYYFDLYDKWWHYPLLGLSWFFTHKAYLNEKPVPPGKLKIAKVSGVAKGLAVGAGYIFSGFLRSINTSQIAISSRPLFKLKKPSVSSLLEFD